MENVGANSHLAHYTTLDTATSQRTLTEFTKRPNWPQIILQGLRDLLHVLTPDGRILYASPSCEAITGYKSTDLVGRFLIEFIHPDDIAVFIEEFSESIASGNPLRFFYRFRKASEEWVIFESHGHPHTDTQLSSRFVSQRDNIYRGFFLMARPYASNISTMFDSFLENKIEIERLEERIAELKHDKEDRNNAPSRAPTDARREIDASFYHAISPLAQFGMWEPPDASNKGPVHLGEEEISTTVRHQNNTGIQDETLGDLGIPISRYRNGDTRVRIRRKRKKPKVTDQYICNCCGTLDSSEWRKGPDGPKTLCNACGLRWSKKNES